MTPPPAADGREPRLPPLASVALGRRKAIPTFRFARREEPDDAVPASPRDIDDPFRSVFFPDARDAFAQAHPLDVLDADADGDDDLGPLADEDSDELPPSLSRAMLPARRRRVPWRSPGVLSAIAGIAVLTGIGLVGFSFLGAAGTGSDEPRIIRADAADVKVRNADVDAAEDVPPQDIAESVALGDSDRLVVPDPVRVGPGAAQPEEDDSRTPRQVRTVIVRPDGTIVSPDAPARGPVPPAAGAGAVPDRDAVGETPYEVAAMDDAVRSDAVGLLPRVIDTSPDVATSSEFDRAPEPADAIAGLIPGAADGAGDVSGPADPAASLADEPPAPAPAVPELAVPEPAADAAPTATLEARLPRPRPTPPPRRTAAAAERRAAASAAGPTVLDPADGAATETLRSPAAASLPVLAAREDTGRVPPSASAPVENPPERAVAPWGVQVSSQRSQEDAEVAFRGLQQRYPALLGDRDAVIAPARLGARGTFYRVRIGAPSRTEAADLCQSLKAAGADCFVGRN